MKPLIGLSTNQEGDCAEQQDTERDGQRGSAVAVVFVASAHLLAATESGTLVALTLVGRIIPAASANDSGVWWKVVHRELDDLHNLPTEAVLVSLLVVVAVDRHRIRRVIVCAGRVVRTVALEATDGVTLVDEHCKQQ